MRHALPWWLTAALAGCGSAPTTEADPPETPVVDVDDGERAKTKGRTADAKGVADAKAAAIASALANIDVQAVGALGDGVAVEGILGTSEVPPGLLDDAARSSAAGSGGGALRVGGGSRLSGGSGASAGGGGSLADIGQAGAASGPPAPRPAGPKGSVAVRSSVSKGKVANASAVVARMRGRFRRCFSHALKSDPNLAGTVTLVAAIGPNGEVLSVSGSSEPLKTVVPCLKAVIASGGFAPPEGGSAEVNVEAIFTKM